jgi:hypothetical protein
MSWNYRIVKYADGTGYGLHEVHYDHDNKPIRMTKEPAGFAGDSPEEVRAALLAAKVDATKRTVFDEPEGWTT